MDADAVLDKQDLTIAREVIDEGRALVIAVNKWDIANRQEALQKLNEQTANLTDTGRRRTNRDDFRSEKRRAGQIDECGFQSL